MGLTKTRPNTISLVKLGGSWKMLESNALTMWNLHQEITIDETIVRYKGRLCPMHQYMPKNSTKFGINI